MRLVRFHDMRHTCATLLLGTGVTPRVVMDLLSHSQIGITMNIYAHVMPESRHEAADALHDALNDDDDDGSTGELVPAN